MWTGKRQHTHNLHGNEETQRNSSENKDFIACFSIYMCLVCFVSVYFPLFFPKCLFQCRYNILIRRIVSWMSVSNVSS